METKKIFLIGGGGLVALFVVHKIFAGPPAVDNSNGGVSGDSNLFPMTSAPVLADNGISSGGVQPGTDMTSLSDQIAAMVKSQTETTLAGFKAGQTADIAALQKSLLDKVANTGTKLNQGQVFEYNDINQLVGIKTIAVTPQSAIDKFNKWVNNSINTANKTIADIQTALAKENVTRSQLLSRISTASGKTKATLEGQLNALDVKIAGQQQGILNAQNKILSVKSQSPA